MLNVMAIIGATLLVVALLAVLVWAVYMVFQMRRTVTYTAELTGEIYKWVSDVQLFATQVDVVLDPDAPTVSGDELDDLMGDDA